MLGTGAGVRTPFCEHLSSFVICALCFLVWCRSTASQFLDGAQAAKLTGNLQNVQGKHEGQMLSPEGKPSSGIDLTHRVSSH